MDRGRRSLPPIPALLASSCALLLLLLLLLLRAPAPVAAAGQDATPVKYGKTGGGACLRSWAPLGHPDNCTQLLEPLVEGKPNDKRKVVGDERIPCCACLQLGAEMKGWGCGSFKSPGHKGVITQEVIDYCHPALEYDYEFKQAKDDDMVPSASWCPNNFAHGKQIAYQFMCDERTGALVCGGGNRRAGRTLVLGNSGWQRVLGAPFSVAAVLCGLLLLGREV